MRTIQLLLATCLLATSVGANIIPDTADWVDMKAGRATTGRTLFQHQERTSQTIEFYGKLSYNFRLYLNYIDFNGRERSCAVQLDPHSSQPRIQARFFEDAPLSGGGGRYKTSANIFTPFREHEEQYWRFRLDASNPQRDTFLLSLDGRVPFSSGVWGEYEDALVIDDGMTPDITWTWSTSMDSARGAWMRDDGSDVDVYSYNESEQRWEDSGIPGYPPPLLPPFVVEMHNDVVSAYNSLTVQNIIS